MLSDARRQVIFKQEIDEDVDLSDRKARERSVRELRMAQAVMRVLEAAYPRHPWTVKVDSKGKTKAVLSDGIGLQFGKLTRATKTYRPGRSFYALRHTFRTVADEVGDRRAIDLVMGHEPGGDIANHYVERISDERLKIVAQHVRGWLFGREG